jgi:hypothetical protein
VHVELTAERCEHELVLGREPGDIDLTGQVFGSASGADEVDVMRAVDDRRDTTCAGRRTARSPCQSPSGCAALVATLIDCAGRLSAPPTPPAIT